ADTTMTPLWQALYDFNADVVLSGHNHQYERFAPQDSAGNLDTARGLREFVAGTGGESHYTFGATQPNSEVRNGDTFGVLKLTLHAKRSAGRCPRGAATPSPHPGPPPCPCPDPRPRRAAPGDPPCRGPRRPCRMLCRGRRGGLVGWRNRCRGAGPVMGARGQ